MESLSFLGICGSLRDKSYNLATLNAAQAIMPANVSLEIYAELGKLPPFDQDSEQDPPPAVKRLKEKILAADAVVFATPEYNYSIPGVLKNAIDWASRPYGDNAWEEKPAAIMSASTGMVGGARAQYHLRQIMVFLNMFPLNKPEVLIPMVNQKVNAKGQLTDDKTRAKIGDLMSALAEWTARMKQQPVPESVAREKFPYHNAYRRHGEMTS